MEHVFVAAWYAETYRLLLFVCVPINEIDELGSRYLVDGFSERDEISQLGRGGRAIHYHPHWRTLAQGVAWGWNVTSAGWQVTLCDPIFGT